MGRLTSILAPAGAKCFDIRSAVISDRHYAAIPDHPFPFVAPEKGWYYMQNTSGEGMLMPLEKADEINNPFSWSGSQHCGRLSLRVGIGCAVVS
jgi:hypothetical protein